MYNSEHNSNNYDFNEFQLDFLCSTITYINRGDFAYYANGLCDINYEES